MANWRLKDITGQKFGRLTVIQKVRRDNDTRAYWLCKCTCGNEKIVSGKNLRSGATVSCGCRMREVGHEGKRDLTGQIFGKLTVVNPSIKADGRGHMCYWNCLCSCGNMAEVSAASLTKGHTKSCGCIRLLGKLNPNWIGGDEYYGYAATKNRIGYAESVRRDPNNKNVAQVRCSVCGEWFNPSRSQVAHRIASLDGYGKGDAKFYCSDRCKSQCSIYGQKRYPKGFKANDYRNEVLDPDLNNLVLIRDSYQCQKCGIRENLEVHHIEGVAQSPMLANDIENCMTVCHSCHVEIHSQPGCTYADYQREACLDSKEAVNQQIAVQL